MQGAAEWGAFYRQNPEKFAEDYLHLQLRTFQKILLVMMFWSTTFVFIACRGLGKTFLSAIYCVVRCILYPGTKICIASGTRGQALAVLEKITYELKPLSPELRLEIDEKASKTNGTEAKIVFHNSSVIKVVTASDSSRGNRCNVLLLDEYRLISKDTIDTVLHKFLTLRRMPKYEELTEEERKTEYDKEKNLTMYLSSAYWKDHWSYKRCEDSLQLMTKKQKRHFVCGFPYQLSISEGLLDPELVEDEMAESDFSDVKFSMEMCALFWGSDEGAFFDSASILKNRKIKYPWYPDDLSSKVQGKTVSIPQKQNGEIRILSADIALMSSRKHNNDATAIFINQLIPTKAHRYTSNIVYTETHEGLHTERQALIIRKLFDEYQCDYIVLDTNGIGLGVFDTLARDIVDTETGEVYPAISCINDKAMAERCTAAGAQKVIWSVKASAQFNSDCALLLREAFRSGRIRLLVNDDEGRENLNEIRGYKGLSPVLKKKFELPYIYTNLLMNELTELQHEENNGRIKVFEKSGMRKDRYSSLSYNYYLATLLENKLSKRSRSAIKTNDFIIKPPSQGKAVRETNGTRNRQSWY